MQNRRNYYRILQAQPDAPISVIKNNYRTLLQKLRLHPDLGGDQSNASLVNQAWQTLRDPVQRHAYDKQLLKDYHIQILSQGSLAGNVETQTQRTKQTNSHQINQRNYYRILNIQTDAPVAIIKASYHHQIKKPQAPIKLLHEAYAVLSDKDKRQIYDEFLRDHTHTHAFKKKKLDVIPVFSSSRTGLSNTVYDPIITDYCHFCKTPYCASSLEYCMALCIECNSPLLCNPEKETQQFERNLARINRELILNIYTKWPEHGHYGSLTNLSPDGLGFNMSQPLQPNQIIKIDSEHFKCISKVIYCNSEDTRKSIGSRFITILFSSQQGTFVSTHA